MTNTASASPQLPTVTLTAQYLKDLSFENLIPGKLARRDLKPMTIELRVTVNVSAIGDDLHETELFLGLTGKLEGQPAFIAELSYAAVHHLSRMDPAMARVFLNVEAARNVYPYAGAILSQTAAGAGLPPLWLDPVDFNALYNSRRADEERARAAATAR
jgi:preprotein translocase subunit SecB